MEGDCDCFAEGDLEDTPSNVLLTLVGGDKDLESTCILSSLSLRFGDGEREGGDNVAIGGSAGWADELLLPLPLSTLPALPGARFCA